MSASSSQAQLPLFSHLSLQSPGVSLVDTHTHTHTILKNEIKNLPHLPPSCDVPLRSDTDQVDRRLQATCTQRRFLKWRRGRTGGRRIGEQIVTDMLISSPSLTTGEEKKGGGDQSKGGPPPLPLSFLLFFAVSGGATVIKEMLNVALAASDTITRCTRSVVSPRPLSAKPLSLLLLSLFFS